MPAQELGAKLRQMTQQIVALEQRITALEQKDNPQFGADSDKFIAEFIANDKQHELDAFYSALKSKNFVPASMTFSELESEYYSWLVRKDSY